MLRFLLSIVQDNSAARGMEYLFGWLRCQSMYLDWITYPKSFLLFVSIFSHFFACFSQIVIWILFVSNKFQNISFFRAHYYYGAAFQSEIKGMPWRRTHKQNRWIWNISFKWSLLTVTFYALCWCLEIHFYVCKKQTSQQQQQQQQNMSPINLNLNFDILAPRMTKGNIQYNSFASHSASLQGSEWLSQFSTFHCYCLPTGAYV